MRRSRPIRHPAPSPPAKELELAIERVAPQGDGVAAGRAVELTERQKRQRPGGGQVGAGGT